MAKKLLVIICLFVLTIICLNGVMAKDPTRWDIPVDESTVCPEHNIPAVPYGKIAGGDAWFHIAHPVLPEALTNQISLEEIKKMIPKPKKVIGNKVFKDIKKQSSNRESISKTIKKLFPGPSQAQFEKLMKKFKEESAAGEPVDKELLKAKKSEDIAMLGYPTNLVIIKFWLEDLEKFAKIELIKKKRKEGASSYDTRELMSEMEKWAWTVMRKCMQCMIRSTMEKKNRSIIQPIMSKVMPSKFAKFEQEVGAKIKRPLSAEESGILRNYMRAQIQQGMRDKIGAINRKIMVTIMPGYVGSLALRMERSGQGVREYLMEKYPSPRKFEIKAETP
jgi:hypothetical protein